MIIIIIILSLWTDNSETIHQGLNFKCSNERFGLLSILLFIETTVVDNV